MNKCIKHTKILLTGATGFVGQYLTELLLQNEEFFLNVSTRSKITFIEESPRLKNYYPLNLSATEIWIPALKGCDIVIHTAARVHIMNELAQEPINAFREVNVEGTLNLARQAALSGVKRFIFISSIKVNGEITTNTPFKADDKPNPQEPYALSKYEAEEKLQALAGETGMEIVIIRPPLIYGKGVKGNFARLYSLIDKKIPLPFGLINNKRSFVSLKSLGDFIQLCIKHPNAKNQIFLISDGHDLSIYELLKIIAQVNNKTVLFFPIPVFFLKSIFLLIGKLDLFNRLCTSLQIDTSKNTELLNWNNEDLNLENFKNFNN